VYKVAELPAAPDFTYTISARSKAPNIPVFGFLRRQFGDIPLNRIESLFGFVERSVLYGGRMFAQRELSDRDVMQLNNAGIGLRLPLSNHHVSREEYDANRKLLEKYHRRPNSVIVTNDDLARWVREDFPEYRIDASVIKNVNNLRKLETALELCSPTPVVLSPARPRPVTFPFPSATRAIPAWPSTARRNSRSATRSA